MTTTHCSNNNNDKLLGQNSFCDSFCDSGYLELIIGPMFAGKTTTLLTRYKSKKLSKKPKLLIKYKHDTRFSINCVRTHCGSINIEADVFVDALIKIQGDILDKYKFIFIDEGQFFPDLHDFVVKMLNADKHIYIAGLNGTFKQEPFPNLNLQNLIPLCDNIIFLRATCHLCKRKNCASFTTRNCANQELIVIGGENLYKVTCRKCMNLYKTLGN